MNGFMHKYGGWLFTALCSFGVVGTAVLAANEAPKAKEAIDKAENERGELTLLEKTKIALPIYIPSIITGSLTIGGMFGTQAFNQSQQAALVVAGTVAAEKVIEYDKYRRAIQAEQGNFVDKRALERAQMREEELVIELEKVKRENGPFLYSISTIPGLIFQIRPADLSDAFMHFNRNLIMKTANDLAELYDFIGIPTELYNGTDAEKYGWNLYINETQYGCVYYDFSIKEISTKNGIPVRFIDTTITPYDLDVDYESERESVPDHFYPGYCPIEARKCIESMVLNGKDGVVEIDHPFLYAPSIWGF